MANIPVTFDFTNQEGQSQAIIDIMNLFLFGQIERPEYFGYHIRNIGGRGV